MCSPMQISPHATRFHFDSLRIRRGRHYACDLSPFWSSLSFIRAFFCHLDRGGKKGVIKPLRPPQPRVLDQSILFSLVKQVFRVRASVYWQIVGHNRARCTKRTAIRTGFESISWQHAEDPESSPNNFWIRLSMMIIWRIMQIELENVIGRSG